MVKCSTSLRSADLSKLADEMKRVEPYSDRFHFDVADGHYAKNMLFSPPMVKALRSHSKLPFEIHLMVANPLDWVGPLAEAGADIIIVCFDSVQNPGEVWQAIRSKGKKAGVSLLGHEPLSLLDSHWRELDIVTICGTALDTENAAMDSGSLEKIRLARDVVFQRSLPVELEAEGGISRETIPLLKASGIDFVVADLGLFKEHPKKTREWLADL